MNGKDFIALRRLSTRADVTLADVGETCERVPISSLPGLLNSGKIRAVEPSDKKPRRVKAESEAV